MSSLSEKLSSAIPVRSADPVMGRPKQITLEQIFAATAAIGLENLTLQAVAESIGVSTPALYRHVKGREDLITKFVRVVIEWFPAPSYQGEGWALWAKAYAKALRDLYEGVPGLADISIRRTDLGHGVLERHEISITAAKESGFNPVSAFYATRAVIDFVASWVARQERRNALQREINIHPDEEFRDFVIEKSEVDYPNLKSALVTIKQGVDTNSFDFTLDALVMGLERKMQLEIS